MKAEIRADGLHISGYVNVPGRMSRPLRIGRERMLETIQQGAFAKAIEKNPDIQMLIDHDWSRKVASVSDGTLEVNEDAVGFHVNSLITDSAIIEAARTGRIKGWSFDMRNVQDEVETRAEDSLPIRTVKDFDMREVSIILDKIPAYVSTSVEIRAGEENETVTEFRAYEEIEVIDNVTEEKEEPEERAEDKEEHEKDNFTELLSQYKDRLNAIKK